MFLAHTNDLSKDHYKPLEQFNREKVLIYSDKHKIVSNICPHQQSLISLEQGQGIRVCPYHNWSFDIDGFPITSGRTAHYCKNQTPLETLPVFEWNHLLFDRKVSFDISVDFKNLILMEERIDHVDADFKTIVDIFLDVDHIQSVHAGVYDLIGIKNTDVTWQYYDSGSVQTVEQGAFWITVYPNTMIEWQQGSLFITVALPNGNKKSKVSVFKYADKNYLDKWKLNEMVWETAWRQDRSQSEIISSFPENNLEFQKTHFRNFLKTNGIY
jgi:phenylpropionate dioxygenase-like ring-hydroxylating dioxygenase large terminal subunit